MAISIWEDGATIARKGLVLETIGCVDSLNGLMPPPSSPHFKQLRRDLMQRLPVSFLLARESSAAVQAAQRVLHTHLQALIEPINMQLVLPGTHGSRAPAATVAVTGR